MKVEQQKGFTLIEILMVLLLVSILSVVATTQFINFRKDAGDANTRESLMALRAGIANQHAQMQLRCGQTADTFPPAADLAANDITTSGAASCTAAQVTTTTDRYFVDNTQGIPTNYWGGAATVTNCQTAGGAACTTGDATACDGTATFGGGWCYDPTTGSIWADSQSNGDAAAVSEESF